MSSRLFAAAWPPGPVLDQLAALDRPDEPGVRWTQRDQWHVTLRFLGECDVGEAAAALDAAVLPPAGATLGPAVARLGRSVIAVPVAGLDDLVAAVVRATGAVGRRPESRPAGNHLTLARTRGRRHSALIGEPFSARFPVDAVHLVESRSGPGGVTYESRSSRRTR